MRFEKIYTADQEEPKCFRCDACTGDGKICEKCGPDFWWQHYQRTEIVDIDS